MIQIPIRRYRRLRQSVFTFLVMLINVIIAFKYIRQDFVSDWLVFSDEQKPGLEPDFPDVVLLGQFNYNTDASLVLQWIERWSDYFQRENIVVRGPFNSSNRILLQQAKVPVFEAPDDAGWYSPLSNLAETLLMYQNKPNIRGVLMTHDDIIFNVTYLKEKLGSPASNNNTALTQVVQSVLEKEYLLFDSADRSFFGPGTPEKRHFENSSTWPRLRPWRWWEHCIPGFIKAVSDDPRARLYGRPSDAKTSAPGHMVPFYANGVGDFMFMPISMAQPYSDLAHWMVDNKVMLECSTPTILGLLKEKYQLQVESVS